MGLQPADLSDPAGGHRSAAGGHRLLELDASQGAARGRAILPEGGGGLSRPRRRPELLRADAEAVHDGGESIALLEAICAEYVDQVGAKRRNVGRAASQENAVDILAFDRGLFQGRGDCLLDEVQLGTNHRFESVASERYPQVQSGIAELDLLRIRQRDLGRFDRLVEVVRVAFVKKGVDELGFATADPGEDRWDARVSHQEPY